MNAHHALLLTDIVDSTRLAEQLGDAAMAAVWRDHDRAAHDLLRRWRGREIDRSDGVLMVFQETTDAAHYALDYHRALARLIVPLKARAGLHVGPLIMSRHDDADVAIGAKPVEVSGLAKPVAARVMSVAQGGQTLMTADARLALPSTGLSVQSVGHWRLKGIEQPVELFELAGDDAAPTPPPDSEKAYRVVRSNELWIPVRDLRHTMPAERDAFIGRRAALHELNRRLREGARLVSVLGTGGIGKTRLVQRFGWTWLGDYPGGVWFSDLSQARSLDGICHAVGQGLDVPLGKGDPVAQLGGALRGRGACLVILDNFEQVCDLAEDTVGQWLDRARDARFIVTTRQVLGIAGEEVLALAPMEATEAAALFTRRAQAARSDFKPTAIDRAAVDPLVRLLDGLPLAIELAAARVRVMPPRTLLQRMSERFTLLTSKGARRDRQATLRATFDWSWDLLPQPEKAALAQLSVFEGGFTLEAAAAALDLAPWPAASVIDAVQSLVEKSLVRRRSEDRFDLLVTVQEYAAEHLRTPDRFTDSGPQALAAARARHWSYFAAMNAQAAIADACADLDNLVAACTRAVEGRDLAGAIGALEAAWEALHLRGPFRVGLDLAARVQAMQGIDARWRAHADRVAGAALRAAGRIPEADACFMAALAAAQASGERMIERRILGHLGDLHVNSGRMDEGRVELTQALDMAREAGDRNTECQALCGLGNLFEHLGFFEEARARFEAALQVARDIGDRRWQGGTLGNLGLLYANQGRLGEARACYEEAIAVARELGDRQWEGNTLCNLGLLHHQQSRTDDARRALEASLQVAREMGSVRLEAVVRCNLGIVHEASGEPQRALGQYEAALRVARDIGDRRSEGQFLNYLGLLHAREGRFAAAAASLDAGEALLAAVSDRFNLAVLLCSRAEASWREGDAGAAARALDRAATLAAEVRPEPESELSAALERVRGMLGAGPAP